jgi:imidazole glycerol-phosphate synthase subunit HisH
VSVIIVDYGMGNLRSVERVIHQKDPSATISSDPEVIASASKLILPGVGHFKNGISKLKQYGIRDVIEEKVLIEKTPILGICLGMQIMCRSSEEGNVEGLGWFDANVVRFDVSDKLKYKIPHMGWNTLDIKKKTNLLVGLIQNSYYYFVHSFYVDCNDKQDILSTTIYETEFTSSVAKGNIYGVQFHPEKSHGSGKKIIENFLRL